MLTSEKATLDSIDRKLSVLTNLIACQLVQGMKIGEGAPLLKRLGFTYSEIATVFDSTTNAVSVRLAEAKKKPRTRKSK